jgi:hypothetical protein
MGDEWKREELVTTLTLLWVNALRIPDDALRRAGKRRPRAGAAPRR